MVETQVKLKSVLPEEVDWKPFAAFPASVRLALLVGDPTQPGPYTIRVKVPSGVMLMPHRPRRTVFTQSSPASFTSAWANTLTPTAWRHIRRALWLCSPVGPPTSTGPDPANT
jgi:hypothetical protein